MTSRLIPALVIPAALLFALTACASGGAGSGDGGSSGGTEGGSGGDAGGAGAGIGCLTDRTWNLDLDDLVAQLSEQMSETVPVTEASATGTQSFEFSSDGSAVATIDSTFVLSVDGDGLILTVTQTHSGAPTGNWSEAGEGTLAFDEWDETGYTITNQISMDGTEVSMPLELPSSSWGGSTMSYECSGSELTTTVPENTYTYRWTTED